MLQPLHPKLLRPAHDICRGVDVAVVNPIRLAFLTRGEITDYGDGTGEREARVAPAPVAAASTCCAPAPKAVACC